MNEIDKILRKLTPKEREAMVLLMKQLQSDYRKIPGIQSLQGTKGLFRIRMGNYRIIFIVNQTTGAAEIRRISRRNEKTYKRLK